MKIVFKLSYDCLKLEFQYFFREKTEDLISREPKEIETSGTRRFGDNRLNCVVGGSYDQKYFPHCLRTVLNWNFNISFAIKRGSYT